MAETFDHRGVPASDDGGGRPYSNLSNFPQGLRVLVFDEDPAYLLTLARQLQEFQYQVTTCKEEVEAMSVLRNYWNMFDIAMIQVNNAEGNWIRFISEIGSEMDLAIIIISEDDSAQSVIEWMRNGAVDYLLKPIRPADLRIIYKHVVTVEAKEKTSGEKSSSVGDSTIRNPNKTNRSSCPNAEDVNEEDYHDRVCAFSSKKKRRIVWHDKLHKKFVDAVQCLGLDKAVPNKILKIMNVEGLTREHVASHLQKYRKNSKKENDKITSEETRNQSLTLQKEIMYDGANASNFFGVQNVQFQTQHINNIPQPSYVQYTTNLNDPTTYPIPPLEHHYDEAFVAVSNGGGVMNHQYHQHHQTTTFPVEENFGHNNFYEEGTTYANLMSTLNPEQLELYSRQDYTSFKMRNDHEAGPSTLSMLHLPPLVSPPRTYSRDQRESGGFNNYRSGVTQPVNNNRDQDGSRSGPSMEREDGITTSFVSLNL